MAKRKYAPPIINGMKACTKCERMLPADDDHFRKQKTTVTGLAAICIGCHREQVRNGSIKIYRRYRLECLIHYSGDPPECLCCKESRLEFLCIDHIDGSGNKHRKVVAKTYGSIFRWLTVNGFPEGYRVLCYNCNSSLGHYGYCPHNPETMRQPVNHHSRKVLPFDEFLKRSRIAQT